MHITDGELRLFFEKKQSGQSDPVLEEHIHSCAHCREKMALLSARAQQVSTQLSALVEEPKEPMPAESAVSRLEDRLSLEKRKSISWNGIFAPRFRTAWISAGLVAGLALAFMFPPVQALASKILRVFRVKQFSVVQVDPQNLQQLEQLGSSSLLAQLISDTAKIESQGKLMEPETTSEASLLAGIRLRVPAALAELPRWNVQPRTSITLYLDLPRIRAVFQEAGYPDIFLPENLQGSAIQMDIPPIATAFFGDCRQNQASQDPDATQTSLDPQRSCTVLIQLLTPTVTAPGDLDINQLGLAMLKLLGLPEAEALNFSQTVDWTSTFVVPIPRYGTYYEEIEVEGVKGTLIRASQSSPETPQRYLLIWTKAEIMYALNGIGTRLDALTIANSLL